MRSLLHSRRRQTNQLSRSRSSVKSLYLTDSRLPIQSVDNGVIDSDDLLLAEIRLASMQASVQASYIYHAGSSFANTGLENSLDTNKTLAKEGAEPQMLTNCKMILSWSAELVGSSLNFPGTRN